LDNNNNWKKNAALFLSSQAISLLGSLLVQYAITWYITLKTQSGIMMSISIICGFLPAFFISPFAGVWADRYSKKMLIALSDIIIAVSTLILAILFMIGFDSIWLLFAISVIRSLGSGVQTPAVGAFVPQIAPKHMLTRVNGIISSIHSLTSLISPILSGALLSIASLYIILFIDVVTATIAVFLLLSFLHVPAPRSKAAEKQKISYIEDMIKGIKYINNHDFLKTIFIFCAVYFVLAAPLAFLTPLQVARSFGGDVWRLTVIEVTFSVGMTAGGIFIASWGGFKNRLNTIVFSMLIISFCTLALGIVRIFWIYSALMALIGLLLPVFNTPFAVLLQEKVDEDYLGRIFGVLSMISSSVMPLGISRKRPDSPVTMDFIPPIGDGEGFAGLELLLISFCGCVSTAIVGLLRKTRKNIISYEGTAEGIISENPMSLTKIIFEARVKSDNINAEDMEKILNVASNISPVWLAVKNNVEVTAKYNIIS